MRARHKWKHNTERGFTEMVYEGTDFMKLTQERAQWGIVFNMIIIFRSDNDGVFLEQLSNYTFFKKVPILRSKRVSEFYSTYS
jgi:hypothetical protein